MQNVAKYHLQLWWLSSGKDGEKLQYPFLEELP